tara:strand:- start:802 stop:1002 length:201 start_codon:yes stop_codon:yes gene_type:complete
MKTLQADEVALVSGGAFPWFENWQDFGNEANLPFTSKLGEIIDWMNRQVDAGPQLSESEDRALRSA